MLRNRSSLIATLNVWLLCRLDGKLLAVWTERGLDAKPAMLFWSVLSLAHYTFAELNSTSITVMTTARNVRHTFDVTVDLSGATFITSASDPGNDTPFDSAFFLTGTFRVCGSRIDLMPNAAPLRLRHFDYRKVEAFEFVPGKAGGIMFGTDDENLVSAVLAVW